jgi:pyruvate formate lyase activating enzyme
MTVREVNSRIGRHLRSPENKAPRFFMLIGGFQKLTLTDYPDSLAAIVFTQGCNLKCPYCYNHALNKQKKVSEFTEESVIDFLAKRKGKLDALVITGGEPTLHPGLEGFIKKVKGMGYLIKLDTNGTSPDAVKRLSDNDMFDYIAMDLKGPSRKYNKVAGVDVDFDKIRRTIDLIMNSGKGYEFRTTMVPGLLEKKDVPDMGQEIKGAKKWFLQKFVSNIDLIDNTFKGKKTFTDKEMNEFVQAGSKYAKECSWR